MVWSCSSLILLKTQFSVSLDFSCPQHLLYSKAFSFGVTVWLPVAVRIVSALVQSRAWWRWRQTYKLLSGLLQVWSISPSIRTEKANLGHITWEMTYTNWLSSIRLYLGMGLGIPCLEQNQSLVSEEDVKNG